MCISNLSLFSCISKVSWNRLILMESHWDHEVLEVSCIFHVIPHRSRKISSCLTSHLSVLASEGSKKVSWDICCQRVFFLGSSTICQGVRMISRRISVISCRWSQISRRKQFRRWRMVSTVHLKIVSEIIPLRWAWRSNTISNLADFNLHISKLIKSRVNDFHTDGLKFENKSTDL